MSRQVKVCPKCGNENRIESGTCAKCYTAISDVPVTESTKPEPVLNPKPPVQGNQPAPPPAQQVPPPPPPPAGPIGTYPGAASPAPPPGPTPGPVGSPIGNPMAGMPGGMGSPIGTYGTPRQETARKSGVPVGPIIALIVVAALAFVGWKFFMKPVAPDKVVKNFLQAVKDKDANKAVACLSKDTITHGGGEEKVKKDIESGSNSATPGNMDAVDTGKVTYEGENVAYVEVVPQDSEQTKQMKQVLGEDFKLELGLVREDGKWKIDDMKTQERLKPLLEKMMKKMFEQMQSAPGMSMPSSGPRSPMGPGAPAPGGMSPGGSPGGQPYMAPPSAPSVPGH